ncbi:hypothetical protein XENOCAPTIV_029454, partial [Xenoophorus captivus]
VLFSADQYGLHTLSPQEAVLCGYTVLISDAGDLLFRASFLVCHVNSQVRYSFMWRSNMFEECYTSCYLSLLQTGSDYFLRVWLTHVQAEGWQCAPSISTVLFKGHGDPESFSVRKSTWRKEAVVLSLREAAAMGYYVNMQTSRFVLRYEAKAEGTDLLWTVPYPPPQLVHGQLINGGVRVGLNGQALSEADIKERGYKIRLQEGHMEVRVPLTTQGGHIKCHDRYFMIAVDLAATGGPRFEAVDGTGTYAITEDYAAKCGYSINVLSLLGLAEFRASYFSCHTEKDDGFSFRFNLITTYDGEDAYYALNKTCSPPLPWSPREVTCEVNYMEVSVRSELPCPAGFSDDWNTLQPLYSASTQGWQVTFQNLDEQLPPMNLSKARREGYVFDLAHDRIVFRTPYGQPESYSTEVNGVPVEVVHATVFSRQSWVAIMVDMIAACSMDAGSYHSGYMIWDTPEALYPSLGGTQISLGLNGKLVELAAAEQKGFIMARHNLTVQIGIPYNADGGYRKSFVNNGIFEFYIFNLYLKQTSVDERHEETALRFHRTLVTPLLPSSLFTEDQTDVAEGAFTVYLGKVPRDVELTSLQLNGQEFEVPFSDANTCTLTEVNHPNKTHSYTLKVPLHDKIVFQEESIFRGIDQRSL